MASTSDSARHGQLHLGDDLQVVLPADRAASTVVAETASIPSATSLIAAGAAYARAATIAVNRVGPNRARTGTR